MRKGKNKKKEDPDTKKQEGKKTNIFREILPYIIILAVVLFLRVFILINASIPSESMEDTISAHSREIGLKCAYWFSEPKRGDIIVFYAPDEPDTPYVKRVIGIPGDTVEIIDAVVYVNGQALEEGYLKEPMEEENGGPYVVPEDCCFVMGDNRNNSWDARYWDNTYVTYDSIIGKLYFSYWPSPGLLTGSAGDTFAELE